MNLLPFLPICDELWNWFLGIEDAYGVWLCGGSAYWFMYRLLFWVDCCIYWYWGRIPWLYVFGFLGILRTNLRALLILGVLLVYCRYWCSLMCFIGCWCKLGVDEYWGLNFFLIMVLVEGCWTRFSAVEFAPWDRILVVFFCCCWPWICFWRSWIWAWRPCTHPRSSLIIGLFSPFCGYGVYDYGFTSVILGFKIYYYAGGGISLSCWIYYGAPRELFGMFKFVKFVALTGWNWWLKSFWFVCSSGVCN